MLVDWIKRVVEEFETGSCVIHVRHSQSNAATC